MACMTDLEPFGEKKIKGHRLINAKFPPISLFDDVADQEDFEALYAVQVLTNPRLQTEVGNMAMLDLAELPYGIRGCPYAVASFTHVNPDGSRFSDGSFGVMYIGESTKTSLAEVMYHQNEYWRNVDGLRYDRLMFKELVCTFNVGEGLDATALAKDDPIYHPDDYSQSKLLGLDIWCSSSATLKYSSVRHAGGVCFALFTPKDITDIVQSKHYEMVWDGENIASVNILVAS